MYGIKIKKQSTLKLVLNINQSKKFFILTSIGKKINTNLQPSLNIENDEIKILNREEFPYSLKLVIDRKIIENIKLNY